MNFIRLFFILTLLVVCSCKTTKIVSFNNPAYESKEYNTYKIITLPSDSLVNRGNSIYDNVSEAIHSEFSARGLKPLERNSELVVRYDFHSIKRDDVSVSDNRRQRGFNRFNSFNPNYVTIRQRSINESILLIELFDRSTKKLVWQASLDLNIPTYKNIKLNDLIPIAVSDLFKTYKTPTK